MAEFDYDTSQDWAPTAEDVAAWKAELERADGWNPYYG